MTPSEKAIQLINKFSGLVTTWDCYNDKPLPAKDMIQDKKACAIICAEEVLNTLSMLPKDHLKVKWELMHWNQVKEAIENYKL